MIAKIYPDNHPDLAGKRDPSHPVRYFDIRKLTEGECLRLMDVPEPDIIKLCNATKGKAGRIKENEPAYGEAGHGKGSPVLSRSAIYKLAGNSIVVSCLRHIFKNIYLTEDDPNDAFELFPEPTFRAPIPSTIRLVTLCSGYDSQAIALQQVVDEINQGGQINGSVCCDGIATQLDLLAWAEYDPERPKIPLERQPAVVAHNILFPQYADRNLGDMTKIDWPSVYEEWKAKGISEIDILTYSTPCQSISQAGKRAGIKKGSGTRSSILWYTENAIRTLRPKFLLQENVRALVNEVNIDDFREWQQVCTDCGYDNYWAILNAKDFGVPQNRERVFMLSVRKDLNLPIYRFPKPFRLLKCIADILDEDVPESYFLKPDSVIKFFQTNEADKNAAICYAYTDHKLSNQEIARIRKENGVG